jgi:hypothetical protein
MEDIDHFHFDSNCITPGTDFMDMVMIDSPFNFISLFPSLPPSLSLSLPLSLSLFRHTHKASTQTQAYFIILVLLFLSPFC